MRITDLATAICACCKQETVGIRPGEKLHELLITRDDAQYTLEFDSFFVIQPAVHLWNHGEHRNYGDEQGRPVAPDFEYASDSNSRVARHRAAQSCHRVARSMRFLGYGRQNIDRGDIDAVVAVLESDFLTQGPQVEKFEAALGGARRRATCGCAQQRHRRLASRMSCCGNWTKRPRFDISNHFRRIGQLSDLCWR